MTLYVSQCDSTVGGPINNDTVPYPLRDWAPNAPKYSFQSSATPSSTATSQSVATLTGVVPTMTSTTISSTGDGEATVLDDTTSTSSRASSTAATSPSTEGDAKPALSIAAIIGIAVGGAVLLALIVGLVACVLRRRKRKQLPIAISPPSYEAADTKEAYNKPELDGQVMEYQYSKANAAAPAHSPVVYVELEGDGRSSPVKELPEWS
jgi:hypothetical protein